MLAMFLLQCLGLTLLSLAMHKHHKQVLSRALKDKVRLGLKTAGWSALGLSLMCIPVDGLAYLYWSVSLSLLHLALAVGLSRFVPKPKPRIKAQKKPV